MTKKQFRALILCYALLIVVSCVAPLVLTGYSQELSDAFDNEPTPWIYENLWALLTVGLPLIAVAVAGIVGLYMFKPWGRTLSLYSTAAALLLSPFLGPTLYGGLEFAMLDASSLVWGAILALSYFSALAVQFNEGSGVQAAGEAASPDKAS